MKSVSLQVMKYIIYLSLFVVIFAACKKEDTPVNTNQQVVGNDTAITSGKLECYIYNQNNSPVGNFQVGLYNSFEDIQRNLPILELTATNNGYANFGYVNFGNYYIQAKGIDGGVNKSGIAVVQVQARRSVTKNIIVTP